MVTKITYGTGLSDPFHFVLKGVYRVLYSSINFSGVLCMVYYQKNRTRQMMLRAEHYFNYCCCCCLCSRNLLFPARRSLFLVALGTTGRCDGKGEAAY